MTYETHHAAASVKKGAERSAASKRSATASIINPYKQHGNAPVSSAAAPAAAAREQSGSEAALRGRRETPSAAASSKLQAST